MSWTLTQRRARMLLVAFSAVVFVTALGDPEYNWDILGYVGSAHSLVESDPATVHSEVFGRLEEAVGAKRFHQLTGSDPARSQAAYRKAMAESPDAFFYQLRYYQIRPVYNGIVFVLSRAGVDPFFATYLISAACVSLGLVLLVTAFLGDRVDARWLLALLAGIWASGIREVAAHSSPDGMAFLLIAIATALFLKGRYLALIYLLPLAPLIRTDLIVFNALLLSTLFLQRADLRVHAVVSGVISITAYLGVNRYFGNEGWANVFFNTFIRRDLHPEGIDYTIMPAQYLAALADGSARALSEPALWIFLLSVVVFATLVSKERHPMSRDLLDQATLLVGWSIAYTLLHFLLFPRLYARFFLTQYVTVLACSIAALGGLSGEGRLQPELRVGAKRC